MGGFWKAPIVTDLSMCSGANATFKVTWLIVEGHITVGSQKYAPPFCTLLWGKSGEGVFAQIFSSSRAYALSSLRSLRSLIHVRSTIKTTAVAFWKNGSFDERVLQEISGACVHTKPRDIEATCIISGDRGRPRVSSHSQCKQHKTWQSSENEVMYSNLCVHVSKHSWWSN